MKMMNKIFLIFVLLGIVWANSDRHTIQALNIYEDQYGALMNNIVNANTPGYRATKVIVSEQNGQIVTNEITSFFRNGQLIRSGNPYHMAIEGMGFFMVQTPGGVMFTRDGRFTLDNEYRLVTIAGKYPVIGQGGEIQFSLGSDSSIRFEVTETGLIVMQDAVVDKILVGEISQTARLHTVNGVFFEAQGGEQVFIPLETPKVRQYYYESSNVDMSAELVSMPEISRKYDANARVLQLLRKIRTTGREMGSAQ